MLPRRSRWLYTAPSASGASPFDTRPAARADDERQVLHADRALVLARAAGRALPQHVRSKMSASFVSSLPASSASSLWRISVFGFSSLPVALRRAVDLAAPALDARERVEHLLALEVLQRLEADLLLLEVEVRHRAPASDDRR